MKYYLYNMFIHVIIHGMKFQLYNMSEIGKSIEISV